MFEEQAKQELFETVKAFHACEQEEGHSVSSCLLKIKSYLDTLEHLGHAMLNELGVSLILNSINKVYDQFVQNYNMHSMGKTIAKLHAMLKLHEKCIPKKAETLVVLAIREAWLVLQGLKESRKLKHGALSVYIGNGMRAAVKAIGSFDLILPSGLIIDKWMTPTLLWKSILGLRKKKLLVAEPTVSPFNDNEIDLRISFDESDDEDYTVVYDENLFSYKIISINNLKTDSENDNDKVNMPSFPSPEPEVSYFNDLDFFKDFENVFPAIVYNDALTSKLNLLT
ncbi:hypothetical protein Tco_0816316 [Tanacetum coccineum]